MIAVIDYGMGNLRSVAKALETTGAEVRVTSDAEDLRQCDRVVLPGVGAFAECIANLRDTGLVDVLDEQVRERGKPFLGICLGMQMLADESYEDGMHKGLGWIRGTVRALVPSGDVKVPHVGWNDVRPKADASLFRQLDAEPVFYFTHSYYFEPADDAAVAAVTEHGRPFAAAIQTGNIAGTQFHPEKSQQPGLSLLFNFAKWRP